MTQLSNLIQRVQPSPTTAAAARAQALKDAGKDVVSFTVGEPDFDTPEHVKRAAVEAMQKGHTRYTAVNGILPLRKAIQAKLLRDQSVEWQPNEIIVTNGGKQAIAAACAVLLNPGDEAIVPAPYWTSYPDIVRMTGAEPVVVQTTAESGYRMTPEQLRSAVTPRTRMVFLNTPSNPTGACYSEGHLRELLSAFRALPNAQNIILLSDEVYEYMTYDGFQHFSPVTIMPELKSQTVLVNAFSKTYAMTGWRVGYAAAPKEIIDAMTTHQSQFTTNVCSIAQHAAVAAYSDNGEFPRTMQAEFQKRLEIVCEAIKKIPGIGLPVKPQGAFYAFLRVEELFGKSYGETVIRSGNDFAQYLLNEYQVVTVQGEAFGDAGAVRMSFALSTDDLMKGLKRIETAVLALR